MADMSGLQDELLEVMPAVEEANSISEELDKRVKFEIMLVAPEVVGAKDKNRTQVGRSGGAKDKNRKQVGW